MTMSYMDSGASSHITCQKASLELLTDPHPDYNVTTTDGNPYSVDRIGNANVLSDEGPGIKLQNVLYVPSLRRNLMSVKSLTDTGLFVYFTNKNCLFHKQELFISQTRIVSSSLDNLPSLLAIGQCDHSNGLYRFLQHSPKISINNVSTSSITELWHKRFGHLYYDGLIHLSRYKRLKVLPYLPYVRHVCEACLAGQHY